MKLVVKRLGYKLPLIVVGVIVVVLALTWLCLEKTVDRSLLTDSRCAAPCWQGILPGTPMETEEIVRILEMVPSVGHISQHHLPKGTEIRWFWRTGSGHNSIFLMRGVVNNISLSVDFELTVEEILDKYGSPEATNAMEAGSPEHAYVGMNLFYPTRGLQFKARVLPWNRPVLEPTTRIFEVVYTVPAESLKSWQESFDFDLHLQPWPGYGELVHYQRFFSSD